MKHSKTDGKVLTYRWLLIAFCLAVAVGCLYKVNRGYDPLARYPYADQSQREAILTYMDDEDIDYIITQQLRPETFMEFLTLPEFDVRNAVYYREAMDTQKEEAGVIVHFVNRYRDVLPLNDLKTLLQHYSYAQLASWYETDPTVQLIPDPTALYALPGKDASVWTYVPEDLQRQQSVYLKPEAAQALKELLEDYARIMPEDKMTAEAGYLRFDEAQVLYEQIGNESLVFPAGQNEQQLGWTVTLTGHDKWLKSEETREPEQLYESLGEEEKDRLHWLEDNAWRYGFVIRWPQDKEEVTGHEWQPFVIRYVGLEKAREMTEKSLVLEEAA